MYIIDISNIGGAYVLEMTLENLCWLIGIVIALLNALLTFLRTGSIKKEVNMKFRSTNYQDVEPEKTRRQAFTNKRKEYALNEHTNQVEETGETDLQELVNSSKEVALDRLLNRFLPQVVEEAEDVYMSMQDDLAAYGELLERAEEYREELSLPLEMSIADIFAAVSAESSKLKADLDKFSHDKKEVKENEKISQENPPKGE